MSGGWPSSAILPTKSEPTFTCSGRPRSGGNSGQLEVA